MIRLKFILPAAVLVAGFVIPATLSFGKVEYTKTTGAKCTVCHTKGKDLNKVGECYKEKKDLKACEAAK